MAMREGGRRLARRARPALLGLGMAALAGCDLLGPSGPEGPGHFRVEVASPFGPESAAVLEVRGGDLGEVLVEGGAVWSRQTGDGLRVVVVLNEPGPIRLRVSTPNVARLPKVTVLEVAGPDNALRPPSPPHEVRVERVPTGKGGAP